jgi:2'-5' RNA ligase
MAEGPESKTPSQAKGRGYSIWLVPPKEAYEPLDDVINRLCAEYSDGNLRYQAPYFSPHITLIGGLMGSRNAVAAKTAQLASLIDEFEVKLGGLAELSDEYFKCVFVKVQKTRGIVAANQTARRIFEKKDDPEYMPHISLIYGFFPKNIRERIMSEEGQRNPDMFSYKFNISRLTLCLTEDTTDKWSKVGDFDLVK